MAAQALLAASAEPGEAGDHVVARLDVRYVRAHRLDDTGALVAEDDGVRAAPALTDEVIDVVLVAVADAGGGGADEYFPADRVGDLDRLDRQRLVWPPEDRCADLHLRHPSACVP